MPGIWWVRLVACIVGVGIDILVVGISPAAASEGQADPIAAAVREALDEWAEYGTTGDPHALGSSFVRRGPQFQQLEAESADGQPSQSDAPLHFDVHDLRIRSQSATAATVWVEVEARRDGFVPEVFRWDFDLIREDGQWRVWTVVPAIERPESLEPPAVDAATTTSTTTTTLVSTEALAGPGDEELAAASSGPVRGTRIPVLSAWIVVVTVIGVAAAGYMAPRIDRSGEG